MLHGIYVLFSLSTRNNDNAYCNLSENRVVLLLLYENIVISLVEIMNSLEYLNLSETDIASH